jgi:hypothetical protein
MLHRDGPGTEESSPSPLTPGGPPLVRVERYVQPRVDRRKHGRMLEQSYNLIVGAEQRVVQEGSSPSGAQMRSVISESGDKTSLAGESGRYGDV